MVGKRSGRGVSKRQLPSIKYLLSLVDFSIPTLSASRRAVERAVTVHDLMKVAKRRVPRVVFDYVQGSAAGEISYARSRKSYGEVELRVRGFQDVSKIDTSLLIFNKRVDLPIIFAPTGYTRFMYHVGEPAVAAVAINNNLIYTLSTMGTTSPAELAAAVPGVRRWFQLFVMKNREDSLSVISQAEENGFEALLLTIDTPVAGLRHRDTRNGLTIPPRIRASTILAIATKPGWWINLLTTKPLEFASFRGWNKSLQELASTIYDSGVTWKDLAWLQSVWDGPIIVKGIQNVKDAKKLAKMGISGLVVSNHGGRQLDQGPVPLEILEDVVAAVDGKVDIYIDGGVMSGHDVYAALALGAKAVLIGRAYLYGIMADGQRGIEKVIEIMRKELINTMALAGAKNLEEVRDLGATIRKQ
jgi:isopentenyl diphosphate isomerase/L-lactate dehydrogenase-like FMN-dependent dehydrogenase